MFKVGDAVRYNSKSPFWKSFNLRHKIESGKRDHGIVISVDTRYATVVVRWTKETDIYGVKQRYNSSQLELIASINPDDYV